MIQGDWEMSNMLERLGLVESDSPPATPPTGGHAATVPAPGPAPTFAPQMSAAALGAEDIERLKALEAQVYATPSTYVIFKRVRETLGNTADLRSVINVLVAANPGVTPAKVLSDIDTHLGIIASKRSEFDGQLSAARISRIDEPNKEIAELTAQNQSAAAQITERANRITQLTKTAQDAERAIADGDARFRLIEDQLSAPLIQTKQLLNSLT